MQNITLVYPLAGLSSRFKGKIKQLEKIGTNNETLLEYSIKQALPAGFTEIIFIVGEKTEQAFRQTFGNSYNNVPIKYAKQTFNPKTRDKPWGTADAACTILPIIKNPFIICNGDDIYSAEVFRILVDHLKEFPEQNAAIGYPLENTFIQTTKGNRGMFTTNENNEVRKIVETLGIEKDSYHKLNLSPEDLSSMNIWALTPKTLSLLNEQLKKFKEQNKDSRTAECGLPTELSNLCEKNKIKMK